MDADSIAALIADYLRDRDDIATAVVVIDDGAPTVDVVTQAGESYAVVVAEV